MSGYFYLARGKILSHVKLTYGWLFAKLDVDGKVVSTSMRDIQQMMMSRPVEVAVAPKTSLS